MIATNKSKTNEVRSSLRSGRTLRKKVNTMIRTYSDPLIAISVSSTSMLGTSVTIVTAESEAKDERRYGEKLNVYFYGKQAENVNGSSSRYLRVTIGQKHYLVHRLVAMAFIPNPEGLPEVDHITRDKTDNSVSNLRWVDHSLNITLMWISIHLGGKAVTPRHRNIQKEKETALSR